METVAIAGSNGFVGSRLIDRLMRKTGRYRVIGLDVVPPRVPKPHLLFYRRDIRSPDIVEIFRREHVDTVVHLAFSVTPSYDLDAMFRNDIGGTENLFEAVKLSGVRHLVVISSTMVYGAVERPPTPLPESAPLIDSPDFPYAHHKYLIEQAANRLASEAPELKISIVRPAILLSTRTLHPFPLFFIILPVIPVPGGLNPPLQFVSEEDLMRFIELIIEDHRPGIFNCAGKKTLHLMDIARLTEKPAVQIPLLPSRLSAELLWKLEILRIGFPPGALDFLCYPWIADTSKAERELGFVAEADIEQEFKKLHLYRKETVSRYLSAFDHQRRRRRFIGRVLSRILAPAGRLIIER